MKIINSFFLGLIISMNVNAKLKIGVPSISSHLNNLEIHSVSEYIIFDDLLRSLIKFDSNGEVAPDLAESWKISDNHKKYSFKLKSNQYFSDHSYITAKDVIQTFERLIKNPEIIHGDGKKIKEIRMIDNHLVEIELFEPDPFFLMELSAPEYRVIKTNAKNYSVTSGAYFIKNKNENEISLELNTFFPFDTDVKYKKIEYKAYGTSKELTENKLSEFNLIWPDSAITQKEIDKIQNSGFYKYELSLGFSYWISINPNTLSMAERSYVKSKLDKEFESTNFFKENNLKKAKQLFLSTGPGRLTEAEIYAINSKVKRGSLSKLRKLKILLPQNIQKELIINIKNSLNDIEISYYTNFSEYGKLIKKNNYDLCLVNNDLSSIDLRSSLLVTFNPSRPLVWLGKNDLIYDEILKGISTQTNSLIRNQTIKELGAKLLEEIVVYPLYHKYGYIFVRNGLDLNSLNKSGAETSSWKIK